MYTGRFGPPPQKRGVPYFCRTYIYIYIYNLLFYRCSHVHVVVVTELPITAKYVSINRFAGGPNTNVCGDFGPTSSIENSVDGECGVGSGATAEGGVWGGEEFAREYGLKFGGRSSRERREFVFRFLVVTPTEHG